MYPIIKEILAGFWTIIKSPSNDWTVLWLLAPIILFWIVLEIYFDSHKKEALGWNTALGNGLSLFWVAISCVKFIFAQQFTMEVFWRTFWIFLIFSYSIFIIWVSFSHKMNEKWTYILASPTPIYFLSCVIVVLSYGVLAFNWVILFDLFILYWIIVGLELILKHYIPDKSDTSGDSLSSAGGDSLGGASPTPAGSDSFGSNSNDSNSDPFSSSDSNDPFKL